MTIEVRRDAAAPVHRGGGIAAWRAARRQDRADRARASYLVGRFHQCMYQAHLAEQGKTAGELVTFESPEVRSVRVGDSPRLNIWPRSGQVLADFEAIADRIAAALHVSSVRITQRPNGIIRIDLVRTDPLAELVALPAPILSVYERITLGQVESGERLRVSLVDVAHLIVQGQTRSGKSRWTYGFLAQLAAAPDVEICGSDVTGVLLRPFAGTRHAALQAVGAGDALAHALVLERLVADMDERITRIPAREDTLPITDADPLRLVVIEETPGLLKAAAATDALTKPKGNIEARIRLAISRLLAEGAKVGYRVLLITQRADASIVGGFERGQAPIRLTFRVDDMAAVSMLHPTCPEDRALAHLTEAPGLALITGPELPIARLRAPQMDDYGMYADLIASACR